MKTHEAERAGITLVDGSGKVVAGVETHVLIPRIPGAAHLGLSRLRVSPGSRTAPVSHQKHEEVWCVVSGAGRFHRSASDGTRQATETLEPGDAVFIPPGYRHWMECAGERDLIFLCCEAPPVLNRENEKEKGEQIMNEQYEYKIVVSDSDDETDQETLNDLGLQGWELVNAVADVRASEDDSSNSEDENVPVTVFYFKRRKEQL
jgi:mannose-6-phosphate isomerase-like protein (cupin superfamily)